MYNNKKNAFTLVELIVVITILAILGTIAFISLQGYSAQARDSKRVSDVANIKKSLELFSLNTGKYPLPDSGVEYSFSGEVLWTQGVVGDQVSTNLSRNLNEKPTDPLSGEEYNYSTINSQTEYEVLASYESDLVSTSPQPSPTGEGARPNVGANLVFAQQSYAATNDYPKINGTYNGIYVKTASYIFPTPSIINALDVETDFKDETTAIQSQIITGGDNLINGGTGALSDLTITYTGVINDDSSDAEKISVIETIQSFYSGTSLASIDEIADILSKTTDEEKIDLADFIVLNSGVVRSSEDGSTEILNGYTANLATDDSAGFASDPEVGYPVSNAFDGFATSSSTNTYISHNDDSGYLGYNFTIAKRINKLRMFSGYSPSRTPIVFEIRAGNEEPTGLSQGVLLYSVDGSAEAPNFYGDSYIWKEWTFENQNSYTHYWIDMYQSDTSPNGYVNEYSVGEIEMMEGVYSN